MSQTKTCECGVEIVSKTKWGFLDTRQTQGNRKTRTTTRAEKQRSRKSRPCLEQENGTSQMRLWREGVQMDTEQAQTNPNTYEEILPSLLNNFPNVFVS
jgi:hypothetical protein